MATHGKKYLKALEKIQSLKKDNFSIKEALSNVKEVAFAKFDESVDVHVQLSIDPSKSDQAVKGSVLLPAGTGRKVKVLVFAKGDAADKALKAGADYVGSNDLMEKISEGWLDFDYVVATPDLMGPIGKLAKILGPKGLLPNVKNGTVTFDVDKIVSELKKGRSFFKNDKSGVVHFSIGKVSFDVSNLEENLVSFVRTLSSAKPAAAKGRFIKNLTVSSSMGPGIVVDTDELMKL